MSEERIKMLREWMENDPADPFLPYALALELKKNNPPEALHMLIGLTSTFPDYLPAWYQLGLLFEESGNKTQAIDTYRIGLTKANEQRDIKTAGEINEAIQRLEFE